MSDRGTATERNVIDEIRQDHRAIEQLLSRVADRNGQDRAGAFDELARYIGKHEAAEQAVVHPETNKIDSGVARGRETEESEADQMLARLRSLDVQSQEFDDRFAEFRNAVLTHAQHEEREEHPDLERDVDPERLVQMAAEFVQAEKDAEGNSTK
jgi:hemerythrin superfamily protein